MKERLLQWWPALPALVILYLGGTSFVEKYPRAQETRAVRKGVSVQSDTLLAFVRMGTDEKAARDSGAIEPGDNPFRPIHQPRAAGRSGSYTKAEPPPRGFILKGTVGSNVATIANNSGHRQIVKVGDRIDSAEVVSIEANKVVLKDRGGRFELLNEK